MTVWYVEQRTLYLQVDHNSTGTITTQEYLNMYSVQGATLTQTEKTNLNRYSRDSRKLNFKTAFFRLAGENGKLRKEDFIKLVKKSTTFSKTFDKNKDSIVTEVRHCTTYLV